MITIQKSFVEDKLLLLGLIMLLLITIFFQSINHPLSKLIKSIFSRSEEDIEVNILNLILYSIFFSLILTYALIFTREDLHKFFEEPITIIFLLSKLIFFMLIQLVIIFLLKMLYQYEELPHLHFYEIVRTGKLWSVSILFIICSWSIFTYSIPVEDIKRIIILSFIVRIILVIYHLHRKLKFNNIYVFSYYFTTEVLPFLFIAKYFIFG